jgi:hypothetical protein
MIKSKFITDISVTLITEFSNFNLQSTSWRNDQVTWSAHTFLAMFNLFVIILCDYGIRYEF